MSSQGAHRPPFDIYERAFQFACAIVRFHKQLPWHDDTLRELGRQLLRAGTSIGSNLEEAKGASSRRDFVAKTAISLREARETAYWLRLMLACDFRIDSLQPLCNEANELVSILTTIVRRSRLPLLAARAVRVLVVLVSAFLILHS